MLNEANLLLYNTLNNGEFESIYNADGGYVWNNKDVEYPSVCYEISNITKNEGTTVFTYRVTAACRQHEGIEKTTQSNYNYLYNALETAFEQLTEPTEYENYTFTISSNRVYQFAPLKLMDVCAVATVEIQLTGYNEDCI